MRHWQKRSNNQDEASVDMTPMLDIVFIILIFFIVTAVFLDERGPDFTHPQGDCVDCGNNGPTIQIYIDAKNRVSVDRVPTTLNGVPSRVERLLADKPDADVLVLASAKATLDPIVYIKDQMNVMGRRSVVKITP